MYVCFELRKGLNKVLCFFITRLYSLHWNNCTQCKEHHSLLSIRTFMIFFSYSVPVKKTYVTLYIRINNPRQLVLKTNLLLRRLTLNGHFKCVNPYLGFWLNVSPGHWSTSNVNVHETVLQRCYSRIILYTILFLQALNHLKWCQILLDDAPLPKIW